MGFALNCVLLFGHGGGVRIAVKSLTDCPLLGHHTNHVVCFDVVVKSGCDDAGKISADC